MQIENLTNPNQEPVDGDLIRYIYDSGDVVEKHFVEETVLTEEEKLQEKIIKEKSWRNEELNKTDFIVPLTDYPQHAEYFTYRQELRDYPQQADFPNGSRPIKP
jgi:hypothetical protein